MEWKISSSAALPPVKVAILHPIRSAYLEFQQAGTDPEFGIKNLEDGLRSVCRMFSSRGIPYHFLDETILEEHGFVKGEQIGCGKCTYDYLVLPHIYTMGKHTEKLLRTYVENGGKLSNLTWFNGLNLERIEFLDRLKIA